MEGFRQEIGSLKNAILVPETRELQRQFSLTEESNNVIIKTADTRGSCPYQFRWGHLLAEKLGLIYHVRRQTFLRRQQEGQVPEPIGSDDLMRLMLCEIQDIASQHLPDFPLDALGVAILKRILEVVKIVAGINTPGEREDFLAFLEEYAIKRKGTGLTVSELYQGYAKARQEPYPEDVFQGLIPELVYQRFGLRKSHDFVRVDDDGTRHCPRGFHGLAWKSACSDGA